MAEPSTQPARRLTMTERRILRMQRRVERWEARRNGPPPPRQLHRAVLMGVMMASMLGLLTLMIFAAPR